MLPESWANSSAAATAPPAKFANTAVPHLVRELERLGARKNRLKAVLCGGAHMFSSTGGAKSPALEIGRRNNEETVKALRAAGIPIRASEVGGTKGRSVEVHVATGEVFVRTVGQTADEALGAPCRLRGRTSSGPVPLSSDADPFWGL